MTFKPMTRATSQALNARRLATIAVTGCGLPECVKCYPYAVEDSDVTDDGPTAHEMREIEEDDRTAMLEVIASMRMVNRGRIMENNATVNTIVW
jgi:hypothetical protein